MIELTDIVVESLIKAASSEAVKRGLDAISTGLHKVFDRGNSKEIKEYILAENLVEPVAKLAQSTIASSYILPFKTIAEAKPQHKVELFSEIVRFGFNLSKQLNMDILLPGSFVSSDTISLFSTSDGYPEIELAKLAVKMGDYTNSGSLCILPADADVQAPCDSFKKAVRRQRLESDGYLSVSNIRPSSNRQYRIGKISAGSVYYDVHSTIAKSDQDKLGLSGDGLELRDWSEGIMRMLRYAAELPSIEALPIDEATKLVELASELKKFYN